MAGHVERRNGRYRARWRPPGGKEINETFDRMVDGKAWVAQQEADYNRGTWVDPRAGRMLFENWAPEWKANQVHHRETTETHYEGDLENHVLPAFKGRPLQSIPQPYVQSWVNSLVAKGLAPNTVHGCYRLLVSIMRAAVAAGKLVRSPCHGINLPEVVSDVTIPTIGQLELVAARLPASYRRIVPTVAGSGERRGEGFGLTEDRIDFLRRTITIDRQLQRLRKLQRAIDAGRPVPKGVVPLGRAFFLVPVKRKASNRVVPVGQHTLDVLAAQIAEFPPGPNGLIFRNTHGGPVDYASFNSAWERATRKRSALDPERPDPAEEHGARDAELLPYFTLHDGRHFYASLLIHHGLSVKAVAARLGDKDLNVVMNTYLHLWPDDDDRTRDAVDAVLIDPIAALPRPAAASTL